MDVGESSFQVALRGGRTVDVSTTVGGVDVGALLGQMTARSERSREHAQAEAEEDEAHFLRQLVICERAQEMGLIRHLPGLPEPTIQDAWALRDRIWGDASTHECQQATCLPASLQPESEYDDPVSGEHRRALGYVYVCKLTGHVHVCTERRCDATSSNVTRQGVYLCRVTGANYGSAIITEGFRNQAEAARDTRTLPQTGVRRAVGDSVDFTGVQGAAQVYEESAPVLLALPGAPAEPVAGPSPPPPPPGPAHGRAASGARRGRRAAMASRLTSAERVRTLRDQVYTKRSVAERIVRALLYGESARASVMVMRRRNETVMKNADQAAAAHLRDGGTAWGALLRWLGATSDCVQPPRVPSEGAESREIANRYIEYCGTVWLRMLDTQYAQEHLREMHWGNHVLSLLYLLRQGRVVSRHGCSVQLLPRDRVLAARLPIAGVVDLRRHVKLGKRAFSKGTDVIQRCLGELVAGCESGADVRRLAAELGADTIGSPQR